MDSDTLWRTAALCVALASAETLHGIARMTLVVPRIGKERANRLSVISGTLLALGICWMLVPGIGLQSTSAHLLLGLVLSAFMAGFDVAIGKLLMRKSWAKIWPDFDPRSGNYLLFGLIALAFIPWLVARLSSS
jgi:hypothetical protein